jgi:phosphotriesterase-related protein
MDVPDIAEPRHLLQIQLQKYGGYGYAHLLRNIVPRLELCGVPRAVSASILRDNPREIFTISRLT